MVANLVVPTATGSDEGAPRPVRAFASSIVLSAIAVAAVAVLGVFKPAAPSGWQNGLAVNSSSGAAYIDQGNELHAVYNITSAKLILGGNFAKYNVPASTLDNSGIPIGPEVGILGAPEDVPDASDMTLGQWSLCQNEASATDETQPGGKTYLEIGYGPSASTVQGPWASTSDVAFIVHDSAADVYLIENGHRYEIGNDQTGQKAVQALIQAVYLDHNIVNNNVTGFWVSDSWLDAFPQGDPIGYPELDRLGSQPAGAHQLGSVGQYGRLQNGSGYVVQTANGVVQLSQFAYDLYSANPQVSDSGVQPLSSSQLNQSAVDAAIAGNSGSVTAGNVFANNSDGTSSYGANWPSAAPAPLYGTDTSEAYEQNVCVGYDYTGPSSVGKLTTWLSAQLPYGTAGSKFGTTQSSSSDYANVVLVKAGSGLIAQGANGTTPSGYEYLIEDSGYRYALLSSTTPGTNGSSSTTTSAAVQLGYKNVTPVPVPNSLLDLIQAGPNLTPSAASSSQGDG
jgi:type VII secretion protein EccB